MAIRSLFRRAAILSAVCAFALSMTACVQKEYDPYDNSTVSGINDYFGITPEDNSNTIITPNETVETTPTVAVPKGQLSLSLLMGVMSSSMEWSNLSAYDHTLIDDTNALFEVADGFGKTCDLFVTFNADIDTVFEATLSYGGTSVDVLTDDTLVIRDVMTVMYQD